MKLFESDFHSISIPTYETERQPRKTQTQNKTHTQNRTHFDGNITSLSIYRSFKNKDKFYCYIAVDAIVKANSEFFKGFGTMEDVQVSLYKNKSNL